MSSKSSTISSINSSPSTPSRRSSSLVQHQASSSGTHPQSNLTFQAANNKCSWPAGDFVEAQTTNPLVFRPSTVPKFHGQESHDSESNVYSLLWMSSSSVAPTSVQTTNAPSNVHNNSAIRPPVWFQPHSSGGSTSPSVRPSMLPRHERLVPNAAHHPHQKQTLPPAAPSSLHPPHSTSSDAKQALTIHLWQVATSVALVQDTVSHQLMLHMLHVPLTPCTPGPHASTSSQATLLHHLYHLDCSTKMALRHAVEETFTRYIHCELASSDPQHAEIHLWLQRLRLFTLQCNQRADGVPPVTMLSHYIAGAQVDPVIAIVNIMKLSFNENHRIAIGWLGGLETLSEVLLSEHRLCQCNHERNASPSSVLLRRYLCVCLTNLTYHLGDNKSALCARESWLEALTAQLSASCDELVQTAASVLRNLSWRANEESRLALQHVQCSQRLMLTALRYGSRSSHATLHIVTAKADVGEHALKSILSALWNLSAHSTFNKMQIVQVNGSVHFLVSTLTYNGLNHSLAIVESGGGILRNIAPLLVEKHETRELLCQLQCVEVLLRQLQSSPSLTVVSNAVGTLLALLSPSPASHETHHKGTPSTNLPPVPQANSTPGNMTSMTLRPAEWSAMHRLGGLGMLHCLMQSKHKLISQAASQVVWHLSSLDPQLYTHFHRRSCPAQWMNLNSLGGANIVSTNMGEATSLSRSVPPGLLETSSSIPTLLNMSGSSSGSLLSQRQQKQWKKEQEEMLLRAASIMSQGNSQDDKSDGESGSDEDKNKKGETATKMGSASGSSNGEEHRRVDSSQPGADVNNPSKCNPRSTYQGQHTYVNIPMDDAFFQKLLLHSNGLNCFDQSHPDFTEAQNHPLQTFLRADATQSMQNYETHFRQERMKVPPVMNQDMLGRTCPISTEGPRVWAIEGSPISGCSVSSEEEDLSGASPLSSISEVTEEDEEEEELSAEWTSNFYRMHGSGDNERGMALSSACGLSPVLESSMEQCEESEIGEDGFTWQTSPQLPQSGRHSSSIRSLLSCSSEALDKNNEASQNIDYGAPDSFGIANSESQLSHVTSTPSLGDLPDSPCQEDAIEILMAHEMRHHHDEQSRINECIHSALPQSTLTGVELSAQAVFPSSVSQFASRQKQCNNSSLSNQFQSAVTKGEGETPLLWLIPQPPIEKRLANSSKSSSATASKSNTNTSDSVKHYAVEGTPLQHSSKASSLSELSLPDLIPQQHTRTYSPPKCDVASLASSKVDGDPSSGSIPEPTSRADVVDNKLGNGVQQHCVSSDEEDDEQSTQLLSQVIQSAMPTTRGQPQPVKPPNDSHPWPVPFKSKLPLLRNPRGAIHPAYSPASTDHSHSQSSMTPPQYMQSSKMSKKNTTESPSSSNSSKSGSASGSHSNNFMMGAGWNSLAGAKQTTTPNCLRSVTSTPSESVNESRGTASFSNTNTCSSLSSLSLELSGIENTLLQECISSAMPLPKSQLAGVTSRLLTPRSTSPMDNVSAPIVSSQNTASSTGNASHRMSNEESINSVNQFGGTMEPSRPTDTSIEHHFLADGSDVIASAQRTPFNSKSTPPLLPACNSEDHNQNRHFPSSAINASSEDGHFASKLWGETRDVSTSDMPSSLSVTSENFLHGSLTTNSHFLMNADEHADNCTTSERWLKSLRRSQKCGDSLTEEKLLQPIFHDTETCSISVCGLTISVGPSSSLLSLEISESDLDALVDPLEIDASPGCAWSVLRCLSNNTNTELSTSSDAINSLEKLEESAPTIEGKESQSTSMVNVKSRLPQLRITQRRPDHSGGATPHNGFASSTNKGALSAFSMNTKRVSRASPARTASPADSGTLQTSRKKMNTSISPSRSLRSSSNSRSQSKATTVLSSSTSSRSATPSGKASSIANNSRVKPVVVPVTPKRLPPSGKESPKPTQTVSKKQASTSKHPSAPSPTTSRNIKRPALPIVTAQSSKPENVSISPSPGGSIRGGSRPPPAKISTTALSPSANLPPSIFTATSPSWEQSAAEKQRGIRGGRRALTGIRLPSSTQANCAKSTSAPPTIRIRKIAPPSTSSDESSSSSTSSSTSIHEENHDTETCVEPPVSINAMPPISSAPIYHTWKPLQTQQRLVATVSPSRQMKPAVVPCSSPLVNEGIKQETVGDHSENNDRSEDDQLIWIHRTEVAPQTVLSRVKRISESTEEEGAEKGHVIPSALSLKKPSPLTIKVAPIIQQSNEEEEDGMRKTPTNESAKGLSKQWILGKLAVEQESSLRGAMTTLTT